MINRRKQSALAGLLLLSAGYAQAANTAYVTDTLTVAVFASSDLTGEPVERLISGTLVDVLQSQGGVAEVRSRSGKTGWLRTTFLTTNLPAAIQLENADHELSKSRAALDKANAEIAELEESLKKAKNDVTWMKAEMNKARKQAKSLEGELKTTVAEASAVDQQTDSFEERLASLQAEKESLEQRLAATILINSPMEEISEAGEDSSSSSFPWSVVTLVLGLLAGFGAGYAWIDRRVRQRFGGARVY